MIPTLVHLLINSSSLYLLYKLVFAKSSHFTVNRVFLLGVIPLSLLLSSITLPVNVQPQASVLLQEVVINFSQTPAVSFITSDLAMLLYSFISFALMIRLLFSFIHLQLIKRKSVYEDGVFYTEKNYGVFSFMHSIYAYSGIKEEDLNLMIIHEKVHIRKHHSIDMIYYELLCAFLWILPVTWLLKKELVQVHEFEADANTVTKEKEEQYCHLLIKETLHPSHHQLIHLFNNQPTLKTRIMMLTKPTQTAAWKYLYILPVLLLLTLISANPAKVFSQETKSENVKGGPEKMPEFPGGSEALIKFMNSKLVYPAEAKDAKAEGKAVLEFVVTKTGKLTDITVVKSSGNKQLDNEAIRVVKMMPDWTPGEINGQKISSKMALPIVFKL